MPEETGRQFSLFILGWQLGSRRARSTPVGGVWVTGIRFLDGRTLGKGGLVLMALLAFGTVTVFAINLVTHPFPAY